MIRLVASDLDGTILKNGAQSLPEGFTDLIKELKKAGIHFAAASGRQYPNMYRMFEPLGDGISYICENGAVTFHNGKMLYQDRFPDDLLRDILHHAMEKEGTQATSSQWDLQYLLPKDEAFEKYLTETVGYICKTVHSVEEIPHDCIKAAVFEEHGTMEENLHYWQARFGDRCKVVTSGNRWLDFIPFHTNKANGVKRLLQEMKLARSECIVFGDEFNDIEMLQSVENSVAMSYAKEGVRAAARFQADSVDEILKKLLYSGGDIEGVL